jgi:hypothetical protein
MDANSHRTEYPTYADASMKAEHPPFVRARLDIGDSLDELNAALHRLGDRISPIISQNATVGDTTPDVTHYGDSEVLREMGQIHARIRSITGLVNNAVNTIEI